MSDSSTPSAEQLYEQWQGELVPVSFSPGFVALSFVVSLIGAATTLELIHRRTSPKGRLNHLLLIGAALAMGGVAIWSMHFIGNQAITIGNGEPQLQIAYSSGVTAASFFLPVLVLFVSFIAIGTSNRVSWWRVGIGGVLAGTAICGMHYVGDASISNYRCEYNTANVVGSAIIAVAASTVALSLFFVFRATWTSSWWKRVISAVVLACAVSGTHWCASVATQYRFVALRSDMNELSRNTTVIVVVCLSVVASILLVGLGVYTAYIMKRYASRAQKVVLASAVFDKHCRVLVSPDGLLPSEKITDSFFEKTAQDSLSVAHPLFHWMYQVSRDWRGVVSLVDGMASHLGRLSRSSTGAPIAGGGGVPLVNGHGEPIENYDCVIRELFCTAAATLATRLKTNLEEVGVLWDDILTTGTALRRSDTLGNDSFQDISPTHRQLDEKKDDRDGHRTQDGGDATASLCEANGDMGARGPGSGHRTEIGQSMADLAEKGLRAGGTRGSLLFLVRRLDSETEAQALEAAGFRFAEPHQVSGSISSSMQIRTEDLEAKLGSMADYAEHKTTMPDPGVHLGLFAVRARPGSGGSALRFDVMARKGARNLLPSVPLPMVGGRLERWHVDFMQQLDRMSITAMLHILDAGAPGPDDAETTAQTETAIFVRQLADGLRALSDWISDPALTEVTVTSKVVEVPCSPGPDSGAFSKSTMIAMRIIIPTNHQLPPATSDKCVLVPLGLFRAYQVAQKDSPLLAAFSRSVHREMAPLLNGNGPPAATAGRPKTATTASSASSSATSATPDGWWRRWPWRHPTHRATALDVPARTKQRQSKEAKAASDPTRSPQRGPSTRSNHTDSTLKASQGEVRNSNDGGAPGHARGPSGSSWSPSPTAPASSGTEGVDAGAEPEERGRTRVRKRDMAKGPARKPGVAGLQSNVFGGILISQEVTVDVRAGQEGVAAEHVESHVQVPSKPGLESQGGGAQKNERGHRNAVMKLVRTASAASIRKAAGVTSRASGGRRVSDAAATLGLGQDTAAGAPAPGPAQEDAPFVAAFAAPTPSLTVDGGDNTDTSGSGGIQGLNVSNVEAVGLHDPTTFVDELFTTSRY